MAKIIERISATSWSVIEDLGPITTAYMVYDDDPNINKYVHDFGRLSVSDTDSIKESLNITSGSQGDKGGLQYTYNRGASFPSAGGFSYQYNDGDYYSIVISPTDNDGNSLVNYFTSILGSVSAKVYITSNINGVAAVDVWNIDSINVYQIDYFSLGGSLIGNSPTLTIGSNHSINIVFAGLNGSSGVSVALTNQTLSSAGWTLVGDYYTYTFSNASITTRSIVDFTPDRTAYTEVTTCGMQPQVTVAVGLCKFYSIFPPQTNITGEITISSTS